MRRLRAVLLCPAILALVGTAHASAVAPPKPTIDPNVMRAARTGIVGPDALRRTPGRAPIVVELARPADDAAIAALRASGVELTTVDGRTLAYDRFVPAHASEGALAALAASPFVKKVSLAPTQRLLPLAKSAELVRLADARGARPELDLLTGAGVKVGDVDSLVDVFQPAFFRADAGYYDWIDVDGDKTFTPGKDAIDLDGDGKASPDEIASVLSVTTFGLRAPAVGARKEGFDPSIDWLFLDSNGNGQRDYGADAGFDDTTPAFGEPLFVPDDVDQNGVLDPGEKVVRLGTSKFEKVHVHVALGDPSQDVDHVFVRGTDLSKTPEDVTKSQLYGFPDAMHATGAMSVVAADVPLVGRRWVGMAPDADLVVSFDVDSSGTTLPTDAATWVLQQKPDVMLYEIAPWTGFALDGSDPLSAIIDESTVKDGVTHTCPTGDEAAAHKHARAEIAAGGKAALPLVVPAQTPGGVGGFTFAEITLNVRGGKASTVTVTDPAGAVITLANNGQGKTPSGVDWYSTTQTSDRGTQLYDVYFYYGQSAGTAPKPLPVGSWKVEATAGAQPIVVDGYVTDEKSSWGLGIGWDGSVSTDESTVGVPSVADHCIAVGAAPDHVQAPNEPWFDMFYAYYDVPSGFRETQDQVRAYSPRGPRLDGVVKPDVLAPDNPWVAYGHEKSKGAPYGSYVVFGGTSGASPHVTGVAALLAQAGIKGDAARDAMRKGARTTGTEGTLPNGAYGYGHLDAARALGVATDGTPPTIAIVADDPSPGAGQKVSLTTKIEGGAGFEIRWDDGYDGTWDTDWAAPSPHVVTSPEKGVVPVKVRVRNASGRVAEAQARIAFGDPKPPESSSGGCGCKTAGAHDGAVPALLGAAALGFFATRRRRRSPRETR